MNCFNVEKVKVIFVVIFGFPGPQNLLLDTSIMTLSLMIKKLLMITEFRHLSGGHLGFLKMLRVDLGSLQQKSILWYPTIII